jgi:hypothetical protein
LDIGYYAGHLSNTVRDMATKHVAVRLDEQTLVRVDALIPSLSTPWRKAKRSDVLRALIHAGLEAETEGGPEFIKPRKRPKR